MVRLDVGSSPREGPLKAAQDGSNPSAAASDLISHAPAADEASTRVEVIATAYCSSPHPAASIGGVSEGIAGRCRCPLADSSWHRSDGAALAVKPRTRHTAPAPVPGAHPVARLPAARAPAESWSSWQAAAHQGKGSLGGCCVLSISYNVVSHVHPPAIGAESLHLTLIKRISIQQDSVHAVLCSTRNDLRQCKS